MYNINTSQTLTAAFSLRTHLSKAHDIKTVIIELLLISNIQDIFKMVKSYNVLLCMQITISI